MNFEIEQKAFLGLYDGEDLSRELHEIYGKPFNLATDNNVELVFKKETITVPKVYIHANVLGKKSYSLITIREYKYIELRHLKSFPFNCIIALTGINPSFEIIEDNLEKISFKDGILMNILKRPYDIINRILDLERDIFSSHPQQNFLEITLKYLCS